MHGGNSKEAPAFPVNQGPTPYGSIMALEVIPSLKLTDHGLVDVEKFEVVDLFL